MDGIGDELLPACQHFQRMTLAPSKGFCSAIDQQALGRLANAQTWRLAQHALRQIRERDSDRGIRHINVDADHRTAGDAHRAIGPAAPDVYLEAFGRPVAMPRPIRIGRPGAFAEMPRHLGARHDGNDGIAIIHQPRAELRHEILHAALPGKGGAGWLPLSRRCASAS